MMPPSGPRPCAWPLKAARPRLPRALNIDPKRIQRLRTAMRRRGLYALQPKAFTPRTTDSTHGLRCAPNRLLNQPKPTQANRVWVSDST